MPRRKRVRGANGAGVSKAELIRQTATAMGESARVRDVVAALKAQGVAVSSPQVSKTLKAAGIKLQRRGRRRAGATAAADPAGATKAERIRQMAKTMKKPVRPRDIISELAKEGMTVSSAQVERGLARGRLSPPSPPPTRRGRGHRRPDNSERLEPRGPDRGQDAHRKGGQRRGRRRGAPGDEKAAVTSPHVTALTAQARLRLLSPNS